MKSAWVRLLPRSQYTMASNVRINAYTRDSSRVEVYLWPDLRRVEQTFTSSTHRIYILLGILIAPSNLITVPFSIEFSMASLTNRANSSGFPARTGNSITRSKLFFAFSPSMLVILLSNKLGAIVTARMPYRARSRARGSVRDAIAPLEAA